MIGLFGVCTETKQRVLLHRRLLATAESERDRLFEMSRDLFGVATFDGELKTINPAWARVLEKTRRFPPDPFVCADHPPRGFVRNGGNGDGPSRGTACPPVPRPFAKGGRQRDPVLLVGSSRHDAG